MAVTTQRERIEVGGITGEVVWNVATGRGLKQFSVPASCGHDTPIAKYGVVSEITDADCEDLMIRTMEGVCNDCLLGNR